MDILERSLADLAQSVAGATRIFHANRLDFCCGGKATLREAATRRGLDAAVIAQQLSDLQQDACCSGRERDWRDAPTTELIEHILGRYHTTHREQLPELIRLARRVEQVHGERDDCPHGLAGHLAVMQQELESHMQKEEQILFPLLARGHIAMVGGPVGVMRMEHDAHGQTLAELAHLTDDITPPRDACNTWRALYAGLRVLREDLMQHIHLENNILFERVGA